MSTEQTQRRRGRGFTLVELLVVIAIIGILVGLLMPAVQAAREAARKMQCGNNLKQVGLAMHQYEEAHHTFPPAWQLDPTNMNIRNWAVGILPYLEQQGIYDRYDCRVPPIYEAAGINPAWAPIAAQNIEMISQFLPVFICPTASHRGEKTYNGGMPANAGAPGFPPLDISWTAAPTDYCITTGVRGDYAGIAYANYPGGAGGNREGAVQPVAGIFGSESSEVAVIRDGLSNTLMVGERLGGGKVYRKRTEDPFLSANFGPVNGGGWGDFLNGEHWFSGALYDGTLGPDGGPCAINCTNLRGHGFFSFHPGGANFMMCDGSVKFIGESVAAYPFACMITRKKNEVFEAPF